MSSPSPNAEFFEAIGDYWSPSNGYQKIGLLDPPEPRVNDDHELHLLTLDSPTYLELALPASSILELTKDDTGSYVFRNLTHPEMRKHVILPSQTDEAFVIGRESTPDLVPDTDMLVSRRHVGFVVLSSTETIVLNQIGTNTGTVVWTKDQAVQPWPRKAWSLNLSQLTKP